MPNEQSVEAELAIGALPLARCQTTRNMLVIGINGNYTTLLSYPGGLVGRGVIDHDRLVGNRERRRRLLQSQERLAQDRFLIPRGNDEGHHRRLRESLARHRSIQFDMAPGASVTVSHSGLACCCRLSAFPQ